MRPSVLLLFVATSALGASSVRFDNGAVTRPPLSAIGGPSSVDYGVRNSGDAASDVKLVYELPAGMAFEGFLTNASNPANVACSAAAGTVTCSMPTLPAGIVWITLKLRLAASVAAGTTLTHSATLTTPSDPSPNGKSVSFATTAAVAPTVEVSSSYPSSVVAGVPFTYGFTLLNRGTQPATNVAIIEETEGVLQSMVQSAGQSASCGPATLARWDCPLSLAPGESVAFAATLKFDPSDASLPVGDTLTLFLLDFGLGESQTHFAPATPLNDVAVTVAAPPQAQVGVAFPVRLSVSSAGPSLTRGIALTVPIPEGSTFSKLQFSDAPPWAAECTTPSPGGSGTVRCNLQFVVPPFPEASVSGMHYVFDLYLLAPATGSLTTRATISTPADVNASNDSASATTVIGNEATADLALSMRSGSLLILSSASEVEFITTVVNNGPSAATNVAIANPLPAGATSSDPSCHGTPVVCTSGTSALAPGAAFQSTLRFRVPSSVKSVTNAATVSAATLDPLASNNSASATASTAAIVFDAAVALADAYGKPQPLASAVGPSAPLLYIVNVTSAPAAPSLRIALPPGSVITSPSQSGNGVTIDGTTVTYSVSLPGRRVVGATAPATPGHYTATVSAPGTSEPAVSLAFDVVAGAQPPPATDLAVLVQPPPVAPPLEAASYAASIVNRGPAPASNVRLAFTLPPRTTLDRIDAPELTCDGAASPIVCTAPTLANGETLRATFAVRTGDVPLGSALAASATATSETRDLDATNDGATGAAIVSWPTEMTVRVDPQDIAVTPGGQFTEVITVRNAGKGTLHGVQVGDTVGRGALQVIAQSAPGATCSGPRVVCMAPSLAPGAQIVVTAVLKAPQSGTVSHLGYAVSNDPDLALQSFIQTLSVVVTEHPRRRATGR